MEEIIWIFLLVCSKTGANSSLKSRVQHLFLTTPGVSYIIKEVHRNNCRPECYLGHSSSKRFEKFCPDIYKECVKMSKIKGSADNSDNLETQAINDPEKAELERKLSK